MSLSFTDPEEWYKQYEQASKKQRYEILLETIQQPLSQQFIEELDLGMCLIETKSDLLSNNLIPELLGFIEILQTKQPEFYKKEFYYYDDFLVTYYLFRDEPDKVADSLSRFMEDPVAGIDDLIVVLDKLRYYGYTDLAVKLSMRAYKPVAKAPGIIGGAEWDFVNVLFDKTVQDAYLQIRNGEEVDWQAFTRKIKKYGFTGDPEWVGGIRRYLTEDVEGGERFVATFKKNKKAKEERLDVLTWEFCRYMFEQKNMDFVCSEKIWNNMLVFWEESKGTRSKSSSPKVYFNFSKPTLDEYLAQLAGGFMSRQQDKSIAILWGIPYVYDFLLSKEIISNSVHKEVMKHVASIKPDARKAFRDNLWEYDFVHRWAPPDSVSEKEFAAESEQFKATITWVTPLSEKPSNLLEDMMNMLKDSLS